MLGFALGIALLTGILFGVLPSVNASRIHVFETRASRGPRFTLVRDLLVAGQVTLTIILLAASIGVGRAFLKLASVDRGFDPNGLVTVSVALDGTTHQAGRQLSYFEEALGRIRRLPGVRAASAIEFLPLYATSFLAPPGASMGAPLNTVP